MPKNKFNGWCVNGKIKGIFGHISHDFTIEDIHKVRENNYNITKDMTPQGKT